MSLFLTFLSRQLHPRHGRRRFVAGLLIGGLALSSLGYAAQKKPNPSKLKPEAIAVSATAIPSFDRGSGDRVRFGRLEYRGGLQLKSSSPSFGGWSGLAIDASGKSLLAVSDAGTWMTATPVRDAGRLVGLEKARLGPLKARNGTNLGRGVDRDAEGVALASGTLTAGTLLVVFENQDRIGRYPLQKGEPGTPTGYLPLPAETRLMHNNGMESVTVLRGGPYAGAPLAFSEFRVATSPPDTIPGWIWLGGKPRRLDVVQIGGFDITDAASLADGSVILLERRFRWTEGVKMRLRLIAAGDLKPGARLVGETLLEATMGQEIDNMEALAVHETAAGETILTLMSDDNFNHVLQRTILLEFALVAEPKAASSADAAR